MNRISLEERKQNILRKLDELKYYDVYYLDKFIDEKINQLYIKRMKEKSLKDVKSSNKSANKNQKVIINKEIDIPSPIVPDNILTNKQHLEVGKNQIFVKNGPIILDFE
jgi:hypothetical protein